MATPKASGREMPRGPAWRGVAWALGVGLVSFALLAYDRRSERFFLDESGYTVQGFYLDLFLAGRWNDPSWISLPAIDLPPLMKYLVGFQLRAHGYHRGALHAALDWSKFFNLSPVTSADLVNTEFATRDMIDVARWPSTILGALGCLAVFGLGTSMRDRRVGLAAAALLVANPLYRQQAHRAVGDVPCEALALSACALALWAWRRGLAGRIGPYALAATLLAGALAGLAVLTRLTGVVAFLHVAAWVGLASLLPEVRWTRKLAVAVGAAAFVLVAIAIVLVGNPTLTVQPKVVLGPAEAEFARQGPAGRFLAMWQHRRDLSTMQQEFYPIYAMKGLGPKARVTVVQGFGRFSPFGPKHSHQPALYDWEQDRWGLLWLPWVLLGAIGALRAGLRQLRAGEPPTAWAVVGSSVLVLSCVVLYIPLAWDRYLLPIQPWNALLAGWALIASLDRIRSALRPSRRATVEATGRDGPTSTGSGSLGEGPRARPLPCSPGDRPLESA
jgi:4-amino-4-deoxy-L-arabinose transferase-like glycosyltransferase